MLSNTQEALSCTIRSAVTLKWTFVNSSGDDGSRVLGSGLNETLFC
jgi:hypothetical protein